MPETRPLPPLLWLRAFEASARTLNFTAAGTELGLTQAAISQHIKLLEAELGTRLFDRRQRGVELTAEGGAYLPHVQAAFRSLARSTDELFGTKPAQTVSILGPVSFMTLWLAPRLVSFRAAFPNIRLAISTMHIPSDYLGGEQDFDIRFGMGDFTGRTSHRLTVERLVPTAAPTLIASLTDPSSWPKLPLLSVSGGREMWPNWFAAAAQPVPARPSLSFDSFVTALEAARNSVGVLLASRPLADAAMAEGSLARLSDIELTGDAGHFITHAAGRNFPLLQREVLAWLLAQAGDALQTAGPGSTALVSSTAAPPAPKD